MVNNNDPNSRYAPLVDENGNVITETEEEIPDEGEGASEEEPQMEATLHTRPSFVAAVPEQASKTLHKAGQATGGVLYKLGTELDSTVPKKRRVDDMADLFRGIRRDDPEVNFDDVVKVSMEDVYGVGGEDMSDLVDVSHDDIMGGSLDDLTSVSEDDITHGGLNPLLENYPQLPERGQDQRRVVRTNKPRRVQSQTPSGMSGIG